MLRREPAEPTLLIHPAGVHIDIVEHAAQVFVAGAHAALGVLVQWQGEDLLDAAFAEDAWQAHGDVFKAVFAIWNDTQRQHGAGIKQDGRDHAAHRQRDAGGGIALQFNDVQSACLDRTDELLPVDGRFEVKLLCEAVKRNTGDIDRIPGDKRRAAVLAEHEARDGFGVDGKAVGEHLAKARCIQQRAGGKTPLPRIVVFLHAIIGQNVDGIGHVDEDRVAGIARHAVHHLPDDGEVVFQQIHPVGFFTRLDGRTCGVDDDLCVAAVLIVAHADGAAGRIGKGERVTGVEHLAQRLLAVQIDKHDFPGEIHAKQ